jgi:hypothetical protein
MSTLDTNFANLSLAEKVFHLHQVGVETTLSILKFIPGIPFKGINAISEITAIPVSAIRGIMAGISGPSTTTSASAEAPKAASSEEPKRIVLTNKS